MHSCECVGVTARGVHVLSVAGPEDNAPLLRRQQQRLLTNPLLVAMGAAATSANTSAHDATHVPASSASQQWLSAPLPPSLHVPTLERLNCTSVLLRIAHQWAASEGPAPAVDLDLHGVLPAGRPLVSVIETTLTGVTPRSALQRKRFGACSGHRVPFAFDTNSQWSLVCCH